MLHALKSYRDGLLPEAPNIWSFKEHLPELRKELYATRMSGLDVSFEQFITAWCKWKATDTTDTPVSQRIQEAAQKSEIDLARLKVGSFGEPSEDEKRLFQEFLYDVGIVHLDNIRVDDLISTQYGLTPFFNELVRRAVIEGLRTAPIYPRIVAERMRSVNAPTVVIPRVNVLESTPENLGEAVHMPMATVSFLQRSINMRKYGLALRITDEAIRYSTMNIIRLLLRYQGQKLGMVFDAAALFVSLNGDQIDNSMTPATIGVADPKPGGAGFTFKDFTHINIRMQTMGLIPDTLIAGLVESEDLHNLPEFQNPVYRVGDRTFVQVRFDNLRMQRIIQILTRSNFPSDTVQVMDSSAGLLQIDGRPLLTESDRNILNETNITKFSQEIVFGNTLRESRVTVRTDLDRAVPANSFDNFAFMAPHDNFPIQQ